MQVGAQKAPKTCCVLVFYHNKIPSRPRPPKNEYQLWAVVATQAKSR